MGKQIPISDTETMAKILATRIEGTITVPAQTGKLEKFGCANVTVIATSKELVPHAPNEFGVPKWVRTGNAKIIAGKCKYSIVVPPNKLFYLTAHGHGRGFACTSIDVWLSPVPVSPNLPMGAPIGPIAVPFGQTRRMDVAVRKVKCNTLA